MGNVNGAKLNWERVDGLLKLMGLSQRGLAKAIGVSPQAIGQYKTGARGVKAENLKKIAEVLKVRPAYIVDGDSVDYETVSKLEEHIVRGMARDFNGSPVFQLLRSAGYELLGVYLDGGANRGNVKDAMRQEMAQNIEVSRVIGAKAADLERPAWVDFADYIYKLRTPGGREVYISEDNFQEITEMIIDLASVAMGNLSRPISPPPEEWRLPDSDSE